MRTLYLNPQREPFEMTDSQACLFDVIYRKLFPRLAITAYTQIGKSEVVSMAVLTRITTFAERWVIVGGSEDKAKIIMNKLIGHIFDNDYTRSKLAIQQKDNVERLRHERSRSKITFNIDGGLGEVFILSGDVSKKGQDAGDILIGHGAENIIADDAQLLPNIINAKMVRMLGGYKDNFLIKIGNATSPRSHHFYKAFQSDRYKKVILDYKIGIYEGRQTKEFFDEIEEEFNDIVLFNSFYKCIFPPADAPISGVWIPILSEDDIESAMKWEKPPRFGMTKLGVDVADTGVDHDAVVGRDSGFAEVKYDNQNADQMTLAGLVMSAFKDYNKVYVDKGGVGAGVCSKFRQEKFPHTAVAFGSNPIDPMFQNRKAEMFWSARNWILKGGKLSKDRRWRQLSDIMYSMNDSNGKIQIMPKKMALNMGIKSPDIADAFACTFYEKDRYKSPEKKEEDFFQKKMNKKKKRTSQYNLKMV